MTPRSHDEPHRQASWLELLFDLSFVVAIAQAARELEHALAAGHVADGLIAYAIVFAAIWWAWMSFTWFANVFDTDDVPYRVLSFVMIAGSLGLAAGIPDMTHFDFRIGVWSYVVMRLAYVAQWARVWHACGPAWQTVARRTIVLVTLVQLGWILYLRVPEAWMLPGFVLLFAAELAVPWVAGWDARAGGHRHHIVERYGLFTIIVLGETILAATLAIGEAVDTPTPLGPLLLLAAGALLIVATLWWIYFDFTTGGAPAGSRRAQYVWGYTHYVIFAGTAAVGAGVALAVAWLTDPVHVHLPAAGVSLVVGGAVSVFLLTVALIESVAEHAMPRGALATKLVAAVAVVGAALAAPWFTVPGSVLGVGLVLLALVVHGVRVQHLAHADAARHP